MTRRDEPQPDRYAHLMLPVAPRLVVATIAGFAILLWQIGSLVASQVPPEEVATPEVPGAVVGATVVLGATAAPQFATALPALTPTPTIAVLTPRGSATASPSPSPTPTRAATGTAAPARGGSSTATPTRTATPSPTPTRTATPSPTPSPTPTRSPTPTATPTRTAAPSVAASPAPAPRSAAPPPAASQAAGGTPYTVVSGDTLWDIAQRVYGNGADYKQIFEANKDVIGNDPGLIKPGAQLKIPPKPSAPAK